jgi:uncharacterized protein (TIGR02145 family)
MTLKNHNWENKNRVVYYLVALIGIIILIQIACKKELPKEVPSLVTINITDITSTSITSGGLVFSAGGVTVLSKGICVSTKKNPEISDIKTVDGTGTGSFTSTISGLIAGTIYYIRAYATNNVGTGYGNQYSVKTTGGLASVTTTAISSIASTTAVSGGNITSDGGSAITDRGVCWSTTPGPSIANSITSDGTGTGIFTSAITGLTAGTTYFVRAYATNSVGTSYGNEISFTTSPIFANCGTLTDADGNTYNTVTIGSQCWMQENLKTTHLNDGTEIPNVISGWYGPTPRYCWVNNDVSLKDVYGGLYNWHTVKTGKLCPSGWHVPSDDEWYQLSLFLDPNAQKIKPIVSSLGGGKLKEAGIDHWASPNTGATNETGFTARGGGYRAYNEPFEGFFNVTAFWTTTIQDLIHAWSYQLGAQDTNIYRIEGYFEFGEQVRCLKDNN